MIQSEDPDGHRAILAPIQLTDKPHFDALFAALAQPISDYSFANTFIWGAPLKLYWARLHRHTCVFANGTGDLTLLMPPLPEPGAADADLRDCIRDCFDIMDAYNAKLGHRHASRIEYVSDELLEHISAAGGLNLTVAPFAGDYIYDMNKMINLDGGALKSKRHARGKFMRENPDHHAEPFDDAHIPACKALLNQWRDHGDAAHLGEINEEQTGSDVLRQRDTLACCAALDQWHALGLTGMSLFVGDQLIGFTLGEAISPTQASIVIEKTDHRYDGSAQFIFSEFCRRYWSTYPECNVGDDWGIPSLRFTKSSYRPTRLLSKHTVTLVQPAQVFVPAPVIPATNHAA
ncbi:DUF2156 domain-containing protein [Planctomycetales bacterium ZRK34]|nr:DUF2156 domain-containing protein [Planctomycetales bacterium ZRK34]